jgi:hypothetical protein
MKAIREGFDLIRNHRMAFNLINIGYFAIVFLGMLTVRAIPGLQQQLVKLIGEAFSTGPLQYVTGAYTNGEIVAAIALTFIINLHVRCFLSITFPSLIIPFSGFVIGAYRALLWGFIFSPNLGDLSLTNIILGIGIAILLVLEGEGYVLALFSAFLQGRAWIKPSSFGVTDHTQGYVAGLRMTLRLFLLMVGMLLIAAVYEVFLTVVFIPIVR